MVEKCFLNRVIVAGNQQRNAVTAQRSYFLHGYLPV